MTKENNKVFRHTGLLIKKYLYIVTVLFIPLFYLCFTLLFVPTGFGAKIRNVGDNPSFNIVISMCIMLGVMIISRLIMYNVDRNAKLTLPMTALWCPFEILLMAAFVGMFLALRSHGDLGYFWSVGLMTLYLCLVLALPYIVLFLLYVIQNMASRDDTDDEKIIRFTDITGKKKLVINANAILYIEANENYVKICYLEGERFSVYQLRNTMKNIEPLILKYNITRCQRSYFINTNHVKLLRKEKEGNIVAELDANESSTIPVSPKYYDEVVSKL